MVVAISCLPEPLSSGAKERSAGAGRATCLTLRAGAGPPRAARRSFRYWTSGLFAPGWPYGTWPSAKALSGIGRPRRSRMSLNSSIVSFFIWWFAFFDSNPAPSV